MKTYYAVFVGKNQMDVTLYDGWFSDKDFTQKLYQQRCKEGEHKIVLFVKRLGLHEK